MEGARFLEKGDHLSQANSADWEERQRKPQDRPVPPAL